MNLTKGMTISVVTSYVEAPDRPGNGYYGTGEGSCGSHDSNGYTCHAVAGHGGEHLAHIDYTPGSVKCFVAPWANDDDMGAARTGMRPAWVEDAATWPAPDGTLVMYGFVSRYGLTGEALCSDCVGDRDVVAAQREEAERGTYAIVNPSLRQVPRRENSDWLCINCDEYGGEL